jgi:hypothetical protein
MKCRPFFLPVRHLPPCERAPLGCLDAKYGNSVTPDPALARLDAGLAIRARRHVSIIIAQPNRYEYCDQTSYCVETLTPVRRASPRSLRDRRRR